MTIQKIPFDFVVSNFIGNGNDQFIDDLSKLKYPNLSYMEYTYTLKTSDSKQYFNLSFQKVNKKDNYYFICSKAGVYYGDYPVLYSDINSPQSKNFVEKHKDEINSWYKDTIKKDNNEKI